MVYDWLANVLCVLARRQAGRRGRWVKGDQLRCTSGVQTLRDDMLPDLAWVLVK